MESGWLSMRPRTVGGGFLAVQLILVRLLSRLLNVNASRRHQSKYN